MLPDTLSDILFVERFYSHAVVTSTSDLARSLTEFPQRGIFVIQADRQTAGRGRFGTPFFSGEGGLWVTILTPLPSMNDHFIHNRALSLAIADVSEAFASSAMASSVADETTVSETIACTIKWPNDIYLRGRKLCGILLENHPGRDDMLVMGFGLNVTIDATMFPDDLRLIATSLSIETGQTISRESLLRSIIKRYQANLGIDTGLLHDSYRKRLYRCGDLAEVDGRQGIFDGIEADGRLRLLIDHEVQYFLAGHLKFIDAARRPSDAD